MSDQGSHYDQHSGENPHRQGQPPAHNFQSNNPWADQSGNPPPQHQQYQQQPFPGQGQHQQRQQYGGYNAPPGPPPSHSPYGQQQQDYAPPGGPPPSHGQAPNRSDTFRESDFVPDAERGEQREALEQFEMNRSGQQSQSDRDLESLQREFPKIDSSLIAALYSDAGSLGATKEMLVELAKADDVGGR